MDMLCGIEEEVVAAWHSEEALSELYRKLKQASSDTKKWIKEGQLNKDELIRISQRTANVTALSASFADIIENTDSIIGQATREFRQIVYASVSDCSSARDCSGDERILGQDPATSSLRRWFLNNISNPFPTNTVKRQLISSISQQARKECDENENTSGSMSYEQCSLWFINSRRRSGWTQFFRQYAAGDKGMLLELVDALKGGRTDAIKKLLKSRKATANESVDDCFAAWKKIMQRATQNYEDETSEWVNDVISQAKAESAEASKKSSQKRGEPNHEASSSAPSSKKRRMSTPPCDPQDGSSPVWGQPLPKRPIKAAKRMPSTRTANKARNASGESSQSMGAVSLFSNGSLASSAPTSVAPSFSYPQDDVHAADRNALIDQWNRLTQAQQEQPQLPMTSSSTPIGPMWLAMPHAQGMAPAMSMPIFANGINATLAPGIAMHMPPVGIAPMSPPSSGIRTPDVS